MSGNPDAEPVKSAIPIADLSAVDAALESGGDALKAAVRKVRPADLGRDLSRRSPDECRAIVEASDERRGTAILLTTHPAVAGRLLKDLDPKRAASFLGHMPTDHQSAILGLLEPEERTRVESALDADSRKMLDRLLSHPPSAVGRLMTPKIWRGDIDTTAAEALRHLKEDETIEVAVNCYVVDQGKLVGVAALRELAVLPPETRLREVMITDVIAVNEKTERGDAAEIIQLHEFLSLPVIDDAGVLVGAVRVDDLLDAALEQVGVGQLNQGGIAGKVIGNIPYFQTSLFRNVRSRITWLILLFVAEMMTGTVLRAFSDELAQVVALSYFVPLLIGTGGNAGSQTVTTIIRALALGEARLSDYLRILAKEFTTGLCLGILLGVIGFFRTLLWGLDHEMAECVGITILTICTWANTVGAVIPLLAQRLKIDPTVVSAPMITTLVDGTGLLIYFTVAKMTLSQLAG
jgi:magnesium transporter